MADHEATAVVNGAVATTNIGGGYVEVQEQSLAHYTKFIGALAAAAGITFVQLDGHGNMLFMVLSIGIAIIAAIGTYQFSSGSRIANSLKFWTNVVAVVLQGILAIVGSGGNIGDVTTTQWVVIGLSVLSALGVAALPNSAQFNQKVIQVGAPDPVTGAHVITSLSPSATTDLT